MSAGTGPVQEGARAQILFRRLNEEIRSLGGEAELDLVCECVNADCMERLLVQIEAYEGVRRFPTRFLVKEGHVTEDVERVVEAHDGVVVVEKTGADAEGAIVHDPRRPGARRLQLVERVADRPLTREVRA